MTVSASVGARILRRYQLYLLLVPTLLFFAVFVYVPMYGQVIAFKDFKPFQGVLGSRWVGLKHFARFFGAPSFWTLVENTVGLSLYQLLAGFPLPVVLALAMNIVRGKRFVKAVQVVTYAPHFVSTVVLVGMLSVFLSKDFGLVNHVLEGLGRERVFFLGKAEAFQSLYVWSGIWQNAGWGSIIYLAALSAIDPELHEAAIVDGATMRQRVLAIDVPGILPTIVVMLILNTGRIMDVGFEKAYLMQNALNLGKSEIIATFVYKMGLLNAQYSFAAAVGLFNAVIDFALLLTVDRALVGAAPWRDRLRRTGCFRGSCTRACASPCSSCSTRSTLS
jgi:putative aldouronate transport system permease protein